jgi:transcriptional regulator with XRE-family HTH domain
MTAFGIRMKAIREARGYSQERLAELAHLHRTYVGGVERGERNVSLVNIWRLADALDVNPSAFFEKDINTQHLPSVKPTKRRGM